MEIDILAFTDVEELDLAGPYEVFGKLAELKDTISLKVVATASTICCRHDLKIERTKLLKDDPGPILVVPGGRGARTPSEERNEIAAYVLQSYTARNYILSVCTGTFLLAEAGILSGKTVTTHRAHLTQLRGAAVVDYRIVQDHNLITCQGVTSGIDAALFLVFLLYGKEMAQEIRERIEHNSSIEEICSKTYTVR